MTESEKLETPARELLEKAMDFLENKQIMKSISDEANKLYGPRNKIIFTTMVCSVVIDSFFGSICDLGENAENIILEVNDYLHSMIDKSFDRKMEEILLKSKRDHASAVQAPGSDDL